MSTKNQVPKGRSASYDIELRAKATVAVKSKTVFGQGSSATDIICDQCSKSFPSNSFFRSCAICKIKSCNTCSYVHQHPMLDLDLSKRYENVIHEALTLIDPHFHDTELNRDEVFNKILGVTEEDIYKVEASPIPSLYLEFVFYRIIAMGTRNIILPPKAQDNEFEFCLDSLGINYCAGISTTDFFCEVVKAIPDHFDCDIIFEKTFLSGVKESTKPIRKWCEQCQLCHFSLQPSIENYFKGPNISKKKICFQPLSTDDEITTIENSKWTIFRSIIDPLLIWNHIFANGTNFFLSLFWIASLVCICLQIYPLAIDIFLIILFPGAFVVFDNTRNIDALEKNMSNVFSFSIIYIIYTWIEDWDFMRTLMVVLMLSVIFLQLHLGAYIASLYEGSDHLLRYIQVEHLKPLFMSIDAEITNKVHDLIHNKKFEITASKKNLIFLEATTTISFLYTVVIVGCSSVFPNSSIGSMLSQGNSSFTQYLGYSELAVLMYINLGLGFTILMGKVVFGNMVNSRNQDMISDIERAKELLSVINNYPLSILHDVYYSNPNHDWMVKYSKLNFSAQNLPSQFSDNDRIKNTNLVLMAIYHTVRHEVKGEIKLKDLMKHIEKMTEILTGRIDVIEREFLELMPFLNYKLLGMITVNKKFILSVLVTGGGAAISSLVAYIQTNSHIF